MNKKYLETSKELLQFIEKSPTAFHAVDTCKKQLEKAGFQELKEQQEWKLELGGRYYVTRNDSALMAFVLPSCPRKEEMLMIKGVHAMAAHSDSPCFKLKTNPEQKAEDYYLKLNVEKYGGMILSTWLDRPLTVAGRVVVKDKKTGELENRLIQFDQDLCVIPNVAIHMNRDMNKGVEYNPQVDMLPLFADAKRAGELEKQIAEKAGVEPAEILGSELYLVARDPGTFLGLGQEYIGSPR